MAQKSQEELDKEAAAKAADESNDTTQPKSKEPVAGDPPVDVPADAQALLAKPEVQAVMNDAVEKAVKAALEQQAADAKKAAELKAAEEQGNYKKLFLEEESRRKVLELDKWRGEALREAGLDIKWFDSIQGDTKETMVAFAKSFKKRLDDELKSREAMVIAESDGTPRGVKNTRARTDRKPSAEQKTASTLRGAFGVNRLPAV